MKKLITSLAFGGGLLLVATACSANKSNTSASQTPVANVKSADNGEHKGMAIPAGEGAETKLAESNHGGHGDHGGMTMPASEGAETTTAKLTAGSIKAGAETKLVIDIKSKSGQPITSGASEAIDKFETFQTKLMHLIVVSDDLQTFSHIHPIYKQKGRFEVQANFPQGGNYTLVSDYKPAGQAEQVSLMQVKVAGKIPSVSKADFTKAKSIGDTKVQLTADNLKVGKETMLVFKMQQANGQPVADLQPYLGERGHLVIMQNSNPLTRNDYIHAHAAQHGTGGEVHFITTFPKAGKYKMWGQFNRNGKIITADFWVNVS
jgi:hypothetical protein